MIGNEIQYVQVNAANARHYQMGFTKVYKEAFSEPPYFEDYTDEQVVATAWQPHLLKGSIFLALADQQVIGLGCSLPLAHMDKEDPNIEACNSLRNFPDLPFDWRQACYMSELAVQPDFRRRGIGRELIQRRLAWAKEHGINYYVMRTAAVGSNSLTLYSKLGAKQIPGLEQDVSKTGVNSASKKRIFLFKAIV